MLTRREKSTSGFRVRVRMPAPRRPVKRGVSTQGVATPHILYLNRWTFTAGQHTYRFRYNLCYITVVIFDLISFGNAAEMDSDTVFGEFTRLFLDVLLLPLISSPVFRVLLCHDMWTLICKGCHSIELRYFNRSRLG
jgi:hypothetical protein